MPKETSLTKASSITDSDYLRTVDATGNSETVQANKLKEYIEDWTVTELNKSRWYDRRTPDNMGVPAYNTATRTFSMSVKSWQSYFEFRSNWVRFEKTTTQSVVRPDVTWVYYFYFDTSWVLQYVLNTDMSYETFLCCAITWLVYWNATTWEAINQAVDEQHWIGMPATTHFRLHMRTGAVYMQGWEITGLAHGSDEYTSISTVLSADEDINIATTTTTTTPFIYRIWADNAFEQTATPDLKVWLMDWGKLQFNKNTGWVWSLEDSDRYVIYYIYWTNDANNPIKKFVGNAEYDSRRDARDALEKEIWVIQVTWLPSPEAYPMYAYIVKNNGNLEKGNDNYIYVDLRHPHYFDVK